MATTTDPNALPSTTSSESSTSIFTNPATTFPPISTASDSSPIASSSSPSVSGAALGASPSPNSGGFGGSENYFFGFLITFVVLLIIFLGCGCVSRQRFVARRRAMLELGIIGPEGDRPSSQVEPTFVEPLLAEKADVNWSWGTIKPLSVVIRPHDHYSTKSKGTLRLETPTPRSTPSPPPGHELSVLARILRMSRFRRRRNQTSGKPSLDLKTQVAAPKPPDPVEVQVAVMVAMPRKPEQSNYGDAKTEYAFGVTEVLYDVRTPSS